MIARRPLAASLAFVVAVATLAVCHAADLKPAAARQRIVDPAVVPAGGGCKHCPPGGCRHHGGGHHHAGCRNGICEPSCPVRPGQFGYYGTQWRKWPGTGVIPVSNNAAATPAQPPRSAVPSVDEESLEPKQPPGTLPPPAADSNAADSNAADRPPVPDEAAASRDRSEQASEPTEPAEEPMKEPAEPAPEPRPEPKPRPKPAADDNLFDEARDEKPTTLAVPPRTLARQAARPTTHAAGAQAQAAAWQPVVQPRSVPRVPFSPAEESAALKTRMHQLRQR